MTKTVRFIGDIHGAYIPYLSLIEGVKESVQVGDFGLGFGTRGEPTYVDSLFHDYDGKHRFIRGNHDNPAACKKSSHWISDGHIENDIMFIGGAASIDRAWRTEGKDWWPTEELSIPALEGMIQLYDQVHPNIMVTHECPEFLAKEVMIPLVKGIDNFRSRTREAFDAMFSLRKPETWIFGHWHTPLDYMYRGTRFICLPINGYIDLEVEE